MESARRAPSEWRRHGSDRQPANLTVAAHLFATQRDRASTQLTRGGAQVSLRHAQREAGRGEEARRRSSSALAQ